MVRDMSEEQSGLDEDNVKRVLTEWLLENGVQVFWEQTNQYNYSTFRVTGTRRKPDLFIRCGAAEPYTFEAVIEVKDATSGDNARRAGKIIDYMYDYNNGVAEYSIGDSIVKPKFFLVATQHSPDGHLFHHEDIRPPSPGRLIGIRCGRSPKFEYNDTFMFIRASLWEEWKRRGKDEFTSLGILISDEQQPLIQCQIFDGKWCPKVFRVPPKPINTHPPT